MWVDMSGAPPKMDPSVVHEPLPVPIPEALPDGQDVPTPVTPPVVTPTAAESRHYHRPPNYY